MSRIGLAEYYIKVPLIQGILLKTLCREIKHTKMSVSAKELLEKAEELRRNCHFGEAINLYRAAAAAPDASEDIKRKSLASVELIQEINGFVNVDLMNP